MKTKNVIFVVLGGVAIGTILGVLFAPDKGVNTRKKIAKKGKDLEDDIKSKLDNLSNKISSKTEEIINK